VRPLALLSLLLFCLAAAGGDQTGAEAAHRGYRFLVDTPVLAPDFDQADFDAIWQVWPEPLRRRAALASPSERRAMAFRLYGLTPRPDDPTRPLQYVVDDQGRWTMNCFACHGGALRGGIVPGLANQLYALEMLTEDMRRIKQRNRKPMGRMELGATMVPLGTTRGTTNAVIFGITLLHGRDKDLNLRFRLKPPRLHHHDMDAPPWWHLKRRKTLYIDGYIEKSHRVLMTFLLIPTNSPDRFRALENNFKEVYRYIESIEAPKYPWPIDEPRAAKGARVYSRSCRRCHGLGEDYPEKRIDIDEIGTDPERLVALTPAQRTAHARSWLGHYSKRSVSPDPQGYVAPPLDGIWASAPYFHNGSVPTLWHLLRPEQRPRVWRRRGGKGYDQQRVGLSVEVLDAVPKVNARERREYFDTTSHSKSAAGHRFPDELTEPQKRALLEFLKTR